jgi:hypothetical protein
MISQILNKIKSKELKNNNNISPKPESKPEPKTCSICYEEFKGQVILPCHEKHTICLNCFYKINKCPFCRTDINKPKPEINRNNNNNTNPLILLEILSSLNNNNINTENSDTDIASIINEHVSSIYADTDSDDEESEDSYSDIRILPINYTDNFRHAFNRNNLLYKISHFLETYTNKTRSQIYEFFSNNLPSTIDRKINELLERNIITRSMNSNNIEIFNITY